MMPRNARPLTSGLLFAVRDGVEACHMCVPTVPPVRPAPPSSQQTRQSRDSLSPEGPANIHGRLMRRPTDLQVVFSFAAWRELGRMPLEAFRAVRAAAH